MNEGEAPALEAEHVVFSRHYYYLPDGGCLPAFIFHRLHTVVVDVGGACAFWGGDSYESVVCVVVVACAPEINSERADG